MENNTIDWEGTNALPKTLQPYLPAIPLYVDLRWATTSTDRDLQNPQYRQRINTLVAKFRGVAPEELNDEAIRVYRRNRRERRGGLALLFLLLVVSIGTSIFALYERSNALEQEQKALKQERIAQDSSKSAIASREEALVQKSIAEQQTLEANQQRQIAQKERDSAQLARRRAEMNALSANLRRVQSLGSQDPGWALQALGDAKDFPPDKRGLAWQLLRQRFDHLLDKHSLKNAIVDIVFHQPSSHWLALTQDGRLWHWATGKEPQSIRLKTAATDIQAARFHPEGQWLAIPGKTALEVYRIATPYITDTSPTYTFPVANALLSYLAESDELTTIGKEKKVQTWDLSTGRERKEFRFDQWPPGLIAETDEFYSMSFQLIAAFSNHHVLLGYLSRYDDLREFRQLHLDLENGQVIEDKRSMPYFEQISLFKGGDRALIMTFNGDSEIAEGKSLSIRNSRDSVMQGYVDTKFKMTSTGLARSAQMIAVGTTDGLIQILDPQLSYLPKKLRIPTPNRTSIAHTALSPNGAQVAATDGAGNVFVWTTLSETFPQLAFESYLLLSIDFTLYGKEVSVRNYEPEGPAAEFTWAPFRDSADQVVGSTERYGDRRKLEQRDFVETTDGRLLALQPGLLPEAWEYLTFSEGSRRILLYRQRDNDYLHVLFDPASGKQIPLPAAANSGVNYPFFDINQNTLACGNYTGQVLIWTDPARSRPLERQAPGPVSIVRASTSERQLAVLIDEEESGEFNFVDFADIPGLPLYVCDEKNNWRLIAREVTNLPSCLRLLDRDNSTRVLAGTLDGALIIHDMHLRETRRVLLDFAGPVIDVVPGPYGQTAFVTGLDQDGEPSTFLADLSFGIVLYEFRIDNQAVQRVAVSREQAAVVAATLDDVLWWIDLAAEQNNQHPGKGTSRGLNLPSWQ